MSTLPKTVLVSLLIGFIIALFQIFILMNPNSSLQPLVATLNQPVGFILEKLVTRSGNYATFLLIFPLLLFYWMFITSLLLITARAIFILISKSTHKHSAC